MIRQREIREQHLHCLCCGFVGKKYCYGDDCKNYHCHCPDFYEDRQINLEDILIVVKNSTFIEIKDAWLEYNEVLKILEKWKLGKPITHQSHELIDYIYKVLYG